MMTQIWIISWT